MPRQTLFSPESPVLLVGIGNEYRGDDAAGLLVARRLRQQLGDRATVLEHSGEPSSLLEVISSSPQVVVVDAMVSAHPCPAVLRVDAAVEPLPATRKPTSTHALGLGETIELGRALGKLPPRLIVYAIQGRNFTHGRALSAEVEAAIGQATERILEELRVWSGPEGRVHARTKVD